jgi:uncharacterized protein YjaZ
LNGLADEIMVLRQDSLNIALREGLRKAVDVLPGPDTTVCVLAADPAADYIKTDLHGVSGITVGAGKIWLLINPGNSGLQGDWQDRVRYTIVHEYHHSSWTKRYYDKATPDDLLNYLVFEGRAESFAHIVYPDFDVPWGHALTNKQKAEVWLAMRPALTSTDFGTMRAMMFGGPNIPHWAGYTIGFDIVESYRKRHPEVSVGSWTAMKPETILAGSDFASK